MRQTGGDSAIRVAKLSLTVHQRRSFFENLREMERGIEGEREKQLQCKIWKRKRAGLYVKSTQV